MDFSFFLRLFGTGVATVVFALMSTDVFSGRGRAASFVTAAIAGCVTFVALLGMIWTAFK